MELFNFRPSTVASFCWDVELGECLSSVLIREAQGYANGVLLDYIQFLLVNWFLALSKFCYPCRHPPSCVNGLASSTLLPYFSIFVVVHNVAVLPPWPQRTV